MKNPQPQIPRVGDVVRFNFHGKIGSMEGTVTKVTPRPKCAAGGVRATVLVLWESGSTGRHDDRVLEVVERHYPDTAGDSWLGT